MHLIGRGIFAVSLEEIGSGSLSVIIAQGFSGAYVVLWITYNTWILMISLYRNSFPMSIMCTIFEASGSIDRWLTLKSPGLHQEVAWLNVGVLARYLLPQTVL